MSSNMDETCSVILSILSARQGGVVSQSYLGYEFFFDLENGLSLTTCNTKRVDFSLFNICQQHQSTRHF